MIRIWAERESLVHASTIRDALNIKILSSISVAVFFMMTAVGAKAEDSRLSLSLQRGYVEASVVKGQFRRGAIDIVAEGDGSDILESIICDDGSTARVSIPADNTHESHIYDGDLEIRSPGIILEPAAADNFGSSSFDYYDRGHLIFTMSKQKTVTGGKIRCKFKFKKNNNIYTELFVLENIENLIKF